jgi:hypothetical protein
MNTKITFGRETGGAFSWEHYLRFAASGILGVIVGTTALRRVSIHKCLCGKVCLYYRSVRRQFSMSHFVVFRTIAPDPHL